jgi:hypothetical protein
MGYQGGPEPTRRQLLIESILGYSIMAAIASVGLYFYWINYPS